ncbi:hypothetical protein [Undibacterium terreum]|uniref:Uncharacterized protein n=1 Tax=Undibacterium terreum TaxID=1224302 RepID=A0A916U5U4_9BURK|nr:hypothetical protein [Undibacterium terreum]GGC61612.1 hypothetical protein GCM10011396_05730 [Undibacterium terreum]
MKPVLPFHEEIVRLLTQPELAESQYYRFAMIHNKNTGYQWSVQTHWCGYTEGKERREIHEGTLFHGAQERERLHDTGYPALIINDEADLKYFHAFGGYALILKSIAEKCFSHHVGPRVSLASSTGRPPVVNGDAGNGKNADLPAGVLAAKRLRLGIFRGRRRCLICGQAPSRYLDVEFSSHQTAVAWGPGGGHGERNSVIICKECHEALQPHMDFKLIGLLKEKYPRISSKYFEDVMNYQSWVKTHMGKLG